MTGKITDYKVQKKKGGTKHKIHHESIYCTYLTLLLMLLWLLSICAMEMLYYNNNNKETKS